MVLAHRSISIHPLWAAAGACSRLSACSGSARSPPAGGLRRAPDIVHLRDCAARHSACGNYLCRDAQLALSFLDVDASGARVRRGVPEVAAMLSLPLPRAAALLQRAKRDIPLVADAEPIQVQHQT